MTENTENNGKQKWIDRLKAFFKNLQSARPKPEETDYFRYQQTEAEYQQEQAEWLESVERKKVEKQWETKDADRKSD
ncbi:MAG: hypothetical protein U5L07_10050 [Desulfobacterales bacterium]|nr:hypothetical protein [Desulfobacterales bacterium]